MDWVTDWPIRAEKSGYRAGKLAENCGVTLRQLERYFRATKGMLPQHWLDMMQLEKGLRKLKAGGLVKEAASASGQKYVENFTRQFKRCYGVPPTELH